METSDVTTAFLQGLGRWKGCCWPTQFGNGKLNLEGLKSSQAVLMARSTAGKERADWTAATRWLEQVERDARKAQEEAELAAGLAILGQLNRALEHAGRACELESRYVNETTWRPLWMAISNRLQTAVILNH